MYVYLTGENLPNGIGVYRLMANWTIKNRLKEIAMANQEDGITQSDVDAVQTQLDAVGSAVVDLEAQLATAMENQEDGITQADVNAVQALLDAVVPEDGITQADVDAAYADGAASVTADDGSTPFNQADVDAAYADGAASVTPEDGISQADVDAALTAADLISTGLIADLQAQLDEALSNVTNNTERAELATKLFGKSGKNLDKIFKGGRGRLKPPLLI
jgi:hypothetical protein